MALQIFEGGSRLSPPSTKKNQYNLFSPCQVPLVLSLHHMRRFCGLLSSWSLLDSLRLKTDEVEYLDCVQYSQIEFILATGFDDFSELLKRLKIGL